MSAARRSMQTTSVPNCSLWLRESVWREYKPSSGKRVVGESERTIKRGLALTSDHHSFSVQVGVPNREVPTIDGS